MKQLFAAIAALLVAAVATPSFAARFAPADTNFTLAGSMNLKQSQGSTGFGCAFSFSGHVTSSGEIKIKRATFCAHVKPSGLPWTWAALENRKPGFTMPMTMSINGFNCGLWTGDGVDDAGVLAVDSEQFSANGCLVVNGGGPSTPTITIVH
jgi:hypothetical protein